MAHRINPRNTDNAGYGTRDWFKFLTRIWGEATMQELLDTFGHSQNAVKAIKKMEKRGWFSAEKE